MRKWQKFRALTWPERMLLLQASALLPATALCLRIVSVQRWQNVLTRLTKKEQNSSLNNSPHAQASTSSTHVETKARQIARLVRAAANHGLHRSNCLQQSLVLWWLLKRNGLESKINFGARKENQQLHAHAWVECCGVALNEDQGVEERYSRFAPAPVSKPLQSQ